MSALRTSYEFFRRVYRSEHDNKDHVMPARVAIEHARAELRIAASGWEVSWVPDDNSFDDICDCECPNYYRQRHPRGLHRAIDGETCTVWCDGADKYIAACHKEHEVYGAILEKPCDGACGDEYCSCKPEVLWSLWGIVDPDTRMRREVAAELAMGVKE